MKDPDGKEVELFEYNGKTYVKDPVTAFCEVNQDHLDDGTLIDAGFYIEGERAYYHEIESYKRRFLRNRHTPTEESE